MKFTDPIPLPFASSNETAAPEWGAFSTSGTGSFMSIQQEVNANQATPYSGQIHPRAYASRPTNPPVGQYNNPVGDMVLPMLMMAAAYIIAKMISNLKHSKR